MADLSGELFSGASTGSAGQDRSGELFGTQTKGKNLAGELFQQEEPQTTNIIVPSTPPKAQGMPLIPDDPLNPNVTINPEAVESIGNATAIGLAKTVNSVSDLLNRPSERLGLPEREWNMKLRALMDSGVPYKEASKQVNAARVAEKRAELDAADAAAGRNRAGADAALEQFTVQNPSEPLRHATNIAQSVATNVPGIAASVALKTPVPALVAAGGTSGVSAYDETRDADKSHNAALLSGGLTGIVETGFEAIPVGGLLRELGADGFAKMVTKYLARETLTELPTTLVQDTIAQAINTPDRPFAEFVAETSNNLKDTLIEAPIAAIVGGSVAGGIHKLSGAKKAEEQLAEYTTLVSEGKAAEAEVVRHEMEIHAEELNNELKGRTLQQSPPTQSTDLPDLPPQRVAATEALDPLDDTALDAALKSLPPPVLSPELANDGTSLKGVDDEDLQIGQTKRAIANYTNYSDPDEITTPVSQLRITQGPVEVRGQELGAVKLAPGQVYGVGDESDAFNADVNAVTVEAYQELSKQFGLQSPLVVRFGQSKNQEAIGSIRRLDSGEFVINPAEARMFSPQAEETLDASTFNPSTKAKILDNIGHEFGHALTIEKFFANASPETQMKFMAEQKTGQIGEDTIAGFAPLEQAVLRDYNQFRQDIKGMNAAEFQARWMSPALSTQRQLIADFKGAYPGMNAESFVKLLVGRNNKTVQAINKALALPITTENRKALQVQKDTLLGQLAATYLSFDEYMAEQLPRYIYDKDVLKGTKARSGEYFGGGVAYVKGEEANRESGIKMAFLEIQKSLRKLFTALKKGIQLANGQTYRIKAGTSFESWVESLSKTAQLMGAKAPKAEVVGKKRKAEKKQTLPEYANTQEVKDLRKLITKSAVSPAQKQTLYKLLRENAPITAREKLVQMLMGRVKMQLDTDAQHGSKFAGLTEEQAQDTKWQAEAVKAWGRLKERSPFFKSFFGDWENAGENASKVVDAKGHPMKVFHATQGDFTTFTHGDIGFHFGNLMAAQARLYRMSPSNSRNPAEFGEELNARVDMAEYRGKRDAAGALELTAREVDWSIIPVYLNIRNPLVMSEDGDTAMWYRPTTMALKLLKEGTLNTQEYTIIHAAEKEFKETFGLSEKDLDSVGGRRYMIPLFQPLRNMLQDKGFDGIQYENYVEGGTSYVAFKSSQVKTANATFSSSGQIHMQTDVSLTNPTGLELDTLGKMVNDYASMGLTARAVRQLARMQWSVLQLQQLAWIHPEFSFLDSANDAAQTYNAIKSRLQAMGDSVAHNWNKLGKETDAKLSRALEAEAEGGTHWTTLQQVEGKWTHQLTAETLEKLRDFGIDVATVKGKRAAAVYLQSKQVLSQQLDGAQVALARRLGQTIPDEREFTVRLNELKKTFAALRQTPFLPRGDYGAWGLVVTEQNGLERKVVYRQMFENNADLVKAREVVSKTLGANQKIRTVTELSDEHRSLLALPTEYVDMAAEALDLTTEQKELLFDLLHPVKSDRLYRPYEKALAKMSGGSKDRMRNFADFVWHNSTMIARTEAIPRLNKAKADARAMFEDVNGSELEMDETTRQRVLEDIARASKFVDSTVGYMLSPPNEWYAARSVVALVYLWGSIKTAALNLAGIATTMSALPSQYGDISGFAALAKAHKYGASLLTTGESGDAEIDKMYNRAIEEGTLIQSYSAHLAGAATAGGMRRFVNRSRWTAELGQTAGTIADLGMAPFTLAENYTRRTTFLSVVTALRDAALTKGETPNYDAIYAEAVKQTDLLQNSYTLANRPVIMRGGGLGGGLVPLMTIFLSFMGHFTFNAAGGYTLGAERRALTLGRDAPKSVVSNTQRMLVLLLLLGGYEALPGAENLLDILDALMLEYSGKTTRQLLREGIQAFPTTEGFEWFNDPRFWGKGFGGNAFGFDISGSLGIGKIIPGTEVLAGNVSDATDFIGNVVPAVAGVAGGLTKWAAQLIIDIQHGKDITKNITKFPGAIGGVASAVEWADKGVRGSQGELIYEPTAGEIAGKALNFNPAGLSEKREVTWAKRQAVEYWTKQKGYLQQQFNYAKDENDREALADVEAKIDAFNDKVIDARMKLTPYARNSEYREHLRRQRKLEAGIEPRNSRNLTYEVEASFGEEEQ